MIAGALEVQMFANIARITKDMNDVKGIVGNSMNSVEKSVQSAKNVIASLGVGLSVGVLAGKFKQVAIETDQLRGNLVTVVGSLDGAGAAFENLTKFAAKTPFTLDQSVSAFIKLKALGLDPSERALMSYGNTASAMGKDMSQMIEAVADASTNEFERLKEFGIKAKQEGDNVIFTFQGVSTVVEKESASIQEYLLGIGESKFGDAMANQMERLPGKISNLEDSIDGLFRKMADDGGTSAFSSGIDSATSAVKYLTDNVDMLYDGAEILAIVLAGRLTSSLVAVGVKTAATTGSIITLNGVMAALGGPVGIALITAAAVYKLTDAIIDLRAESYRLSGDEFAKQSLDVMSLSAEQAAVNIDAAKKKISELRSEESALEAEIAANNNPNSGANAIRVAKIAELNRQLDLQYSWLNLNKLKQNELATATVENTEATTELAAAYMSTSEWLNVWNASIKEHLAEQKRDADAQEKQEQGIRDTIAALRQQQESLGMTARAQVIYNATMQAANDGALPEQIALIAQLEVQNYDIAESQRLAGAAAKAANDEAAKSAAEAAKLSRENWQRTHEYMTVALVDLMDNGGNAWDNIAKGFEKMVKRMVAEWAASGLMGMFTGQGTSGFTMDAFNLATGNGGGGGGVGLGTLGSIGSTIGSLFGGGASAAVPAANASAAAWGGFYGGGAATGTTAAATGGLSSSLVALASNPATWAVAALAIAAKNDFWKDPDDYKRSYAGFLTAPTAGAAGSTFGVDAFASGFRAQGIAHNTDQGTANTYIDTFRKMDASIVELVRQLGGNIDASGATFAGVGKEGQLGTSGTFLGMGGKTTEQDIAGMVNLYVSQLTNSITGIDAELLSAVKAASSAEEAVRLLSEAMVEEEVALSNMEKARLSASQQILNAYESGITELDSIERAYSAFQSAAKRGLTAAMISQSTGILESEIQRVLDAGAALGGGGAANDPARNVFGSDLWAETARQAWQPDAEFKAALAAVGINTNTGSEIPSFASGGFHSGGLRLVGENGPELEYTGPSYIANAHNTNSILKNTGANGTASGEMQEMMMEMRKMVEYTKKTSDLLVRVTRDGESLVTVAA